MPRGASTALGPTLSRVLAGVDPGQVRAALVRFTQTLLMMRTQVPAVAAIDGTCLRGVHEDETAAHVLPGFAHEAGVVLAQMLVPSVRDEVTAAEQWISPLAAQVPGLAVLTADALDADQDRCAAIVAQDDASLLRRKKTKARSSPTPTCCLPVSPVPPM